jgi:hypothetical protein
MKAPQSYSKWQWLGWPFIVLVIYLYVMVKEFSQLGASLPH